VPGEYHRWVTVEQKAPLTTKQREARAQRAHAAFERVHLAEEV
jgi:hypothetical protein